MLEIGEWKNCTVVKVLTKNFYPYKLFKIFYFSNTVKAMLTICTDRSLGNIFLFREFFVLSVEKCHNTKVIGNQTTYSVQFLEMCSIIPSENSLNHKILERIREKVLKRDLEQMVFTKGARHKSSQQRRSKSFVHE